MRSRPFALLAVALVCFAAPTLAQAADNYVLDAAHSGVNFRVSHLGLSWTFGRFNEFSGNFTLDAANAANSSFAMSIKTESIDTNNKQRDDHLRSPDFFNARQFPAIAFRSTAVKPVDGGYQVTGEFTLHGVTRPISFNLMGGRMTEFPKGVVRTGFTAELSIKRSEFGMDKFLESVGDEVIIAVSFEGTKK